MRTLQPSRGALANKRWPAAAPRQDFVPPTAAPLRGSDFLLLLGVAALPLVDLQPGAFTPKPESVSERVIVCDLLFLLAMVVEVLHWLPGIWRGRLAVFAREPRRMDVSARDSVSSLPFPDSPIWWGASALLIAIVLSWCANPLHGINQHMVVAGAAQVYLLAIGLLVAAAICRWRSIKPLVIAWIAGFAFESAICVYDSLALLSGHRMIYPATEHRLRGTFRTSGQLAGYSLTSFFVILAGSRLLVREQLLRRGAYVLAGLAPLFIILASRRSALASLLVGLITLLIVSRHRLKIIMSAVVPATLAAVVLLLLAPADLTAYFQRRVEPLIGQDPQRVGVALDHFHRGIEAFSEHPLLGLGFGAFNESRFGFREDTLVTHEQHSGYLAILAETGLVGFSILIFLHLAVLWQILRVWFRGRSPYNLLAADMLVLFATLATSEIYNRIWRERSLWVVLGIVATLSTVAAFSMPRSGASGRTAVRRFVWPSRLAAPAGHGS